MSQIKSPIDTKEYWDELYKQKQNGWNIGYANPVFVDLIEKELLKSCRLLIPGCGFGYEAIFAAKKGFDVTALDFSSEAISVAKEFAEKENVNINFICEDIFNIKEYKNYFDAVFEYTTFCAINLNRREEFAEKISSLIKNEGRFYSLVFPIDGREGGPPFPVDILSFYKIFSKYLKLELSLNNINSIKPRKGKEILQVYLKK